MNTRTPEPGIPPAEQARIKAGFGGREGLLKFCKKVRCCTRYVRQIEIHGGAPYVFLERACALLNCGPEVYDLRDMTRALPRRDKKAKPKTNRKETNHT